MLEKHNYQRPEVLHYSCEIFKIFSVFPLLSCLVVNADSRGRLNGTKSCQNSDASYGKFLIRSVTSPSFPTK